MHASRFPAQISSSPSSSAGSSRSPGLRRAALALAVVALATPWLAQAQSTQGPVPVRVGVVGPFTGPSADFGVPMLNGIKLAVDEINAVGGYLGRPLELIVKDDMADPARGAKRRRSCCPKKSAPCWAFATPAWP